MSDDLTGGLEVAREMIPATVRRGLDNGMGDSRYLIGGAGLKGSGFDAAALEWWPGEQDSGGPGERLHVAARVAERVPRDRGGAALSPEVG